MTRHNLMFRRPKRIGYEGFGRNATEIYEIPRPLLPAFIRHFTRKDAVIAARILANLAVTLWQGTKLIIKFCHSFGLHLLQTIQAIAIILGGFILWSYLQTCGYTLSCDLLTLSVR